jgi:hypothetical protein
MGIQTATATRSDSQRQRLAARGRFHEDGGHPHPVGSVQGGPFTPVDAGVHRQEHGPGCGVRSLHSIEQTPQEREAAEEGKRGNKGSEERSRARAERSNRLTGDVRPGVVQVATQA